jgi:hypothetical protein
MDKGGWCMIRFILILGESASFTLGSIAWIVSIGLVIFKIYIYIGRDEIARWSIIDLIPHTIRHFGIRWFGKYSYVILDTDITIFFVLAGLFFIVIAIFFDIAAKRFSKKPYDIEFERRSHIDRRVNDRRQDKDRKVNGRRQDKDRRVNDRRQDKDRRKG